MKHQVILFYFLFFCCASCARNYLPVKLYFNGELHDSIIYENFKVTQCYRFNEGMRAAYLYEQGKCVRINYYNLFGKDLLKYEDLHYEGNFLKSVAGYKSSKPGIYVTHFYLTISYDTKERPSFVRYYIDSTMNNITDLEKFTWKRKKLKKLECFIPSSEGSADSLRLTVDYEKYARGVNFHKFYEPDIWRMNYLSANNLSRFKVIDSGVSTVSNYKYKYYRWNLPVRATAEGRDFKIEYQKFKRNKNEPD